MKINRILLVLMTGLLVIQFGCEKKIADPKIDQPRFQFEFINGPYPGVTLTDDGMFDALKKRSESNETHSYYNMARVLVIDLSGFGKNSWYEFSQTPYGEEYIQAMYSWTGERRSHSAWKGFFGNYFDVIVDQNLTFEEDHAVGTVNGAIGLNRIIVALTDGDTWVYRGEGDAIGEEGEKTTVRIYMENVESWGNVDSCVQKSMVNSPEEMLFDEAFQE